MRKTETEDPAVERALNFLASMPSGNTTLTSKQVRALLLKVDGQMMSRGYIYDIMSRKIGPGVYRVCLEPWKG